MALIIDATAKLFDLAEIKRGDCVRVKRAGDTSYRNGFVTRVNDREMQILYCNTQNNATSYLTILASDAAIGVWEIWYTSDFINIGYENNAPDSP